MATDRRLLDRDYGQWTGTGRESVVAQWGSVDDALGVEPVRAVRERAVRGLTDIARRSRGGTAVVVSHDAVNRQVLVAFDGGLGGSRHAPARQRVLQHAELRGDSWTVLSVKELLAAPPGVTIAAAACMFQRGRSAALSASLVAGQASCRDASGLIRECLARRW